MATFIEAAALASTGLFAGGALYVSLVEAPALEELHESGGDALAYFRAFFPKAAALQSPMAFTAATLSIGTFIVGADKVRLPGGYVLDNGPSRAPWLVSGMLMGSVIPYTLKLMMPLNKQLLLAESNAQPRAWKGAKLALWAKLHHFRTAASCAALGFVVYKFVAKDD